MTTDAARVRRKSFTLKMALAYIAALIGIAATVALPIVMIQANDKLNTQQTKLNAKDQEIKRLKSQNRKVVEREKELLAQYEPAPARSAARNSNDQPVTVMKVPPEDQAAHTSSQEIAKSHPQKTVNSNPLDFDAKVSLLYEKVMGTGTRARRPHSDDFTTRLNRLHEKVMER